MEAPPQKKLYVCFTMDVERIRSQSPPGGTPTWECGELCVRSYCDALLQRGYPATLFIVPDTAEKQARLFQQMRADGHECGLHIHPQGWGDNYKNPDAHDYLGGYSGEQQFEMLGRAKGQWANAIGVAPDAFRAGNFSANDETFRVLDALQFRSSSTSQPGRVVPGFRAVWAGATRIVHRAHRGFRLIEGDLDLVEVPATVDATRTEQIAT
jgi:peptidoglycan/xylan/chitin deacetylase (PgdA/CDA1 family)